jgi:hypothetical protein
MRFSCFKAKIHFVMQISCRKKFQVMQHLKTSLHQGKLSAPTNKRRQQFLEESFQKYFE